LIEASKEAREKGKASTRCAQDCCVADVPLPGASLLALSRDESVLAACAGSEIKFFSVASLLTDKVRSSPSAPHKIVYTKHVSPGRCNRTIGWGYLFCCNAFSQHSEIDVYVRTGWQ
jgi:hypothetical protein